MSKPRIRRATALAVVLAALAAIVVTAGFAKGGQAAPKGHQLDHVFVIMLENHSQSSVIGDVNAPYITGLAKQYAVAQRYYGVTHPSEPNYVAAISGSNWGINDDNPANRYDHWNLVDQLEAHHLTWAAYMETMPSAGYDGDQYPANAALYVNKHNPFILMNDVRSNAARTANIKPYSDFAADMAKTTIPNFVWISPNQCHDMHGGVYSKIAADGSDGTPCPYGSAKDDANDAALKKKADDFTKGAVQAIMATTAWKAGRSAIFVVTDENDYTGAKSTDGWESADGCCDTPWLPKGTQFLDSHGKPDGNVWQGGYYGGGLIPAIVIAADGKRAYSSDMPYNHYSLLATAEWNWNLGYIGNAADHIQVQPMREFLTK